MTRPEVLQALRDGKARIERGWYLAERQRDIAVEALREYVLTDDGPNFEHMGDVSRHASKALAAIEEVKP